MHKQKKHFKLLMTTDTLAKVWQHSLDLARALATYKLEINLASMGALPGKHQLAEVEAIPNIRLHQSSYKLEWQDNPWDEIEQASMWLLHLEQQLQPDLVHLHHYVFGELPWDQPVIVSGHDCLVSRWEATQSQALPAGWKHYQERVSKGLQAADCLVVPSGSLARQLETHYGTLPKTAIIPYGIAGVSGKGRANIEQILLTGIGESDNLQSYAKIAADLPYPLTIIGEQPSGRRLPGLRFTAELSPSQLNDYLTHGSIFVSASRYEAFGWTALKAASRGCILVLSDLDAHHEIWQDAALYFDPAHPESLRQILLDLHARADLSESLSKKATERARAFDIHKQAKQFYELYQQHMYPTEQKKNDTSYV